MGPEKLRMYYFEWCDLLSILCVLVFNANFSVWFLSGRSGSSLEAFEIFTSNLIKYDEVEVVQFFLADLILCVIQDIELSREINDSFRQSAQARLKLPSGIEMNVHVLTTG